MTLQLCRMSEMRYSLAIFLDSGVSAMERDSQMHSTISSPASACSMHHTWKR